MYQIYGKHTILFLWFFDFTIFLPQGKEDEQQKKKSGIKSLKLYWEWKNYFSIFHVTNLPWHTEFSEELFAFYFNTINDNFHFSFFLFFCIKYYYFVINENRVDVVSHYVYIHTSVCTHTIGKIALTVDSREKMIKTFWVTLQLKLYFFPFISMWIRNRHCG